MKLGGRIPVMSIAVLAFLASAAVIAILLGHSVRATAHKCTFIFPNGSSGKFQIFEDPSAQTVPQVNDGRVICQFVGSTSLSLKPADFANLEGYVDDKYQYADGKVIADGQVDSDKFPQVASSDERQDAKGRNFIEFVLIKDGPTR